MYSTQSWTQQCWVGDTADKCYMAWFVDASFAGDIRDSKSTSGMYMVIIGPNTFVPITWFCKKQGAVSHSSSEAELIALDAALRIEGISSLLFWDVVMSVLCPTRGDPPPALRAVKEKQPQNKKNISSSQPSENTSSEENRVDLRTVSDVD